MPGSFAPGFERGPEGAPDPVAELVESWSGSMATANDVITDLEQRMASGEITSEQAYQTALQLGAINPDKLQ